MKWIFSLFTPLLVLSVIACSNGQTQTASNDLPPKMFDQKLKELNNEILLDVRTVKEYKDGHLLNSINIDWNGDNFDAEVAKLDKTRPVFVYCYAGGRSSEAADAMRKSGFKQVYNLDGGIQDWRSAGLPETKE